MEQNLSWCRSQWPCGLRRGSAAARLLGLRVRIPPGASMSVSCECCVLSGRVLCDGLITRREETFQLVCLNECDREFSITRRPWPSGGLFYHGKNYSAVRTKFSLRTDMKKSIIDSYTSTYARKQGCNRTKNTGMNVCQNQ